MIIDGIACLLVRAEEAYKALGGCCVGFRGRANCADLVYSVEIEGEVRVAVLLFQVHSLNMLLPGN